MKVDWQKGVLYLATMGMEGCWLYALLALINQRGTEERLSVMGVLVAYPLAFGFNKLLRRLRHRVLLNGINWLVWLAVMLITVKLQLYGSLSLSSTEWLLAVPRAIAGIFFEFRPELIILFSTAVVWWLGSRLAYGQATFAASVSEFQFGLAMLLLTFFIAYQLEVELEGSVLIALSFFFLALIGTSIAHAREGTGWLSSLYQGHWSGLLLVSISLVLALGLLISVIVTPDLLQLILIALNWVWELIIKAIEFLISLLPEPGPPEPLPPLPMLPKEPSEEGFKFLFSMPESVRNALQMVWAVLFFGFALFALWRVSSSIFSWLRRRLAGMAGAEYEAMPGAFRADLISLLKRILGLLHLKFLRRIRGRTISLPPELVSIRQIYRQLLRWAATGGHPRVKSQTPQEYCYALVDLLPQVQPDLEFITEQYVRARYGTPLAGESKLYQLKQSWHRVKENNLKKLDKRPREKEAK